MAKQPKKPVKTAKVTKTAKTTKATASKQPKTATKPAKAPASPKAKAPAKATKAKAPAKATAAKKPDPVPAKAAKTTKTKTAPKAAKTTKPKVQKKLVVTPVALDGAPATPEISSPALNATVSAGVDITVNCTTNRSDFGYIVQLTNVTPPGPPSSVSFSIPAPAGTPFSTTIPGVYFTAGQNYQLQVSVDPGSGATPPNEVFTIDINT